ncbi:MAG: ATP-binding protein, partial [Polyangiaceae bacterium]
MSARDTFDEFVAGHWPLVQQWIASQQAESLNLDFKRRRSGAPTGELDDSDKDVLGKAMSGLANVDGGVLLFGLETNKAGKGEPNRLNPETTTQASAYLADAPAFQAALQRHFRNVTTPTVPGVMIVMIEDPAARPRGVVAVYVPSSDARPHRTAGHLGKEISHRYYMRTDTDTVPMPHEMLAALFGRTPPARLTLSARWNGPEHQTPTVNLYLRNGGRGTAHDPIVRLEGCEPDQLFEPILARRVNRTPELNFLVLEPYEFKVMYPG